MKITPIAMEAIGVFCYIVGKETDKFDYLLSHIIPGRGFRSEEESLRLHRHIGVRL